MSGLSDIIFSGINSLENNPDNIAIRNLFNTLTGNTYYDRNWTPPVDIFRYDEYIFVNMDIPGIDAKKLEIDFYNDKIKISGERIRPEYTDSIKNEIVYRPFEKNIKLPISVTSKDSVSVKTSNGVLEIIIDVSKEERNRFRLNVENDD